MIKGIAPSQIRSIQLTHIKHSRKLMQINRQDFSKVSLLDPQLVKVVVNKKYNHEHWKKFKQQRLSLSLSKENASFRSKLEKIKMGNSIYCTRYDNLAHSRSSSFYIRKKREIQIHQLQPQLNRKIQNAHSFYDRAKDYRDFSQHQQITSRLERFPVFQRLSSISHKKSIKTEGNSPLQNSIRRLSHLAKRKNNIFDD